MARPEREPWCDKAESEYASRKARGHQEKGRAVEQRDAADEAGASDGASPLISVFGRPRRARANVPSGEPGYHRLRSPECRLRQRAKPVSAFVLGFALCRLRRDGQRMPDVVKGCSLDAGRLRLVDRLHWRTELPSNRMKLTAPRVGRAVNGGVDAAVSCAPDGAHRRRSLSGCSTHLEEDGQR